MKRLNYLFVAFCLITLTSKSQQVRIETEVGDILVELYPEKAPKTVSNFLRYVDGGFYNGGSFYRTVRPGNEVRKDAPIEVIQAGVHPWKERNSFPPIPLERTNATGLSHVAGAISMARTSPDSATSSFFICVGDYPSLDFGGKRHVDGQGFAVFGKVLEGMEVVKRIHVMRAEGQALMPPVRILSIERVSHR
ncbi:MAG: peptidylprolyl isomerase [Ignavibacteriales bacterium]|nr:peptidylprolyl isomerase [Ignavibacteriales bacterium]